MLIVRMPSRRCHDATGAFHLACLFKADCNGGRLDYRELRRRPRQPTQEETAKDPQALPRSGVFLCRRPLNCGILHVRDYPHLSPAQKDTFLTAGQKPTFVRV